MKLIQSKVVNRKATICLSNVVRIDESSIQFRKQAIVSSIPTKKKHVKEPYYSFQVRTNTENNVSLILKSLEHGI